MGTLDLHGRPLRNLRLSVTDRCNLRCRYCMPEESYTWLPREDILSFEEALRLTEVFTDLGVRRVRLTGGEPLLRRNLPALVAMLAELPELEDLALTSNGVHLQEQAQSLREAGLPRLTVSLDTLKADRFEAFNRRPHLHRVLAGLDAAADAGFDSIKLNSVIIRGFNDDEIVDLLAYARDRQMEIRFIEYMDVGGATDWEPGKVVGKEEIRFILQQHYGAVEELGEQGSAPAQRFRLQDGTVFGIVASTTAPFCSQCDRSRLTADGRWYLCLYGEQGLDLREPLRAGLDRQALAEILRRHWQQRDDRGAEQRLQATDRTALWNREKLHGKPHLEMHTRGG
ncbi:MAG: GTP 3',8-cyclase MoaA [Planctomycetota bacterium]|nr:MAG: GTP 3',8-cyclase MoaA [Planctomycetota bacterium]